MVDEWIRSGAGASPASAEIEALRQATELAWAQIAEMRKREMAQLRYSPAPHARFEAAALAMEIEELRESSPWLTQHEARAQALAQRDPDGDWRLFDLYVRENRAGLPDRRLRIMVEHASGSLVRALDERHAEGRISRALKDTASRARRALCHGDVEAWHRAIAGLPRRARQRVWDACEDDNIEIFRIVSIEASAVHSLATRVHDLLPSGHQMRQPAKALASRMRLHARRSRADAAIATWRKAPSELRDFIEWVGRTDAGPPFLHYEHDPKLELMAIERAAAKCNPSGGKPRLTAADVAANLIADHHCELQRKLYRQFGATVHLRDDGEKIVAGPGGKTHAFLLEVGAMYGVPLVTPRSGDRLRRTRPQRKRPS